MTMRRLEIRIRDANDEELTRISEAMGLALNLEELRRIKRYFVAKNREPTDVELQSIAQAWSEHCCYKSSKRILQEFIFGIDAPQNMVVIKEDAGVVEFDKEHAYVVAFESHNHPSAVEPYGGAATGIGGIVRDVVCLDGNEFIFIRNCNDEKTLKIGEYIESLKGKSYEIDPETIQIDSPEEVEILSFDTIRNIPYFSKVKQLFKRKTKEILEIKTEHGRFIRVTPEHPMIVLDNNDNNMPKIKLADNLEEGDCLPLLSALPNTESECDTDRIDLIRELEKRGIMNISIKPRKKEFKDFRKQFDTLLKKIGANAMTRCNYFRSNYMPLKTYLELEKMAERLPITRADIFIRAYKGRGGVPAVIEIDEGFARLIGYYLADGCISTDKRGNKCVQWAFNTKEKEYIEDVCCVLSELNLKFYLRQYNDFDFEATSITVNSRVLGFLFEDILGCGVNCYQMKIPSRMFKVGEKLKIELLKGIFRGDGDVKINKRRDRKSSYRIKIRFGTSSQILFQQVVLLLQSFGYIPYTYTQFVKKAKTPLHVLEISNISDAKRLGRLFSKKDMDKIEKYFGRIEVDKNESITKRHPPLTPVRIDEIKKIMRDQWVYDLTVEGTHLFTTSYGIVTHNCMGAQPIALIDPLFFGHLNYPDKKLPAEIKHPRFLFDGVVAGISDYGNRIGIPTCAGMVYFDDGYVGNCVVNVGCVGIMKKTDLSRSRAKPGEVLVLVGGKTGRDGIHGVTFASVELTGEEESRSAVQVGDPITKEPLMHAILEANEKGLISGMKDLGGGGLSCAVSEMCHAGGCGADVHLERVKLKEEGLNAWEIWVSESQERFLIAALKDKVEELQGIFDKWDVDAVVIGQTKPFFRKESFTKETKIRLFYDGELVFELDTDFLVSCPVYERPREIKIKEKGEPLIEEPRDYNEVLEILLGAPNIASKESVIRQYDHEVRASTVLKPMQGIIGKETHGDATVIKPLEESYKGLAITSDVKPSFCKLSPFWGAASAIDEVCRNLTAVAAVPHSFADCLNFGNPEKPDRMGDFYECCRGLGYMASSLGVPFVSGNVSFYNESAAMGESIPPTPTILGIGLCEDVRECITVDVKEASNFIYVIGETKEELGGSEYYRIRGVEGGIVPRTDPEVLMQSMNALREAMQVGLIASCHDISEGGLAIAVCEMLIGGDIGASIDIAGMNPELRSVYKLFSESNTRWVVEVWREEARRFEELMNKRGVCIIEMGETMDEKRVGIYDGNKELVNLALEEVREAWSGKLR